MSIPVSFWEQKWAEKADIVVVKDAPVPDAVLHATRESLLHMVETQVLVAIRDF